VTRVREQVGLTPKAKSKAKSKKGSAKTRVAVATVLTAAAVNLIGCQILTLVGLTGAEAQVWKRARAPAPYGSFSAVSMTSPGDRIPSFVWLREAERAHSRLARLRSIAEESSEPQHTDAVAEGEPGVQGTAAAVEPPDAHAATFSQRMKGAAGELWQNVKTVLSPRSQALNVNPERAADPKAKPGLGGTPAQATPSSRVDSRSLLNSQLRENLQALHGTRTKLDPSPLGKGNVRGGRPPTPPPGPVFSPRAARIETPMSELQ
jgi:hypothetical protein